MARMGESIATKDDLAATRADVAAVRARLEAFELRMTNRMYAAVAAGVGLLKVLDFLIG